MLRKTPVIAMSSLTGENVQELMPVVFKARDRWARVISTGNLNRWLAEVLQAHPPPRYQGRETKIKYITQTKGRPPTFLLFCNVAELPVSYIRYLVRNFQDTFEYFGMEIRMAIKKSAKTNPFATKKKRSGLGGREARIKRKMQQLKEFGTVQKRKRRRYV
jgi:GTP-binding protein